MQFVKKAGRSLSDVNQSPHNDSSLKELLTEIEDCKHRLADFVSQQKSEQGSKQSCEQESSSVKGVSTPELGLIINAQAKELRKQLRKVTELLDRKKQSHRVTCIQLAVLEQKVVSKDMENKKLLQQCEEAQAIQYQLKQLREENRTFRQSLERLELEVMVLRLERENCRYELGEERLRNKHLQEDLTRLREIYQKLMQRYIEQKMADQITIEVQQDCRQYGKEALQEKPQSFSHLRAI